MLLVRIASRILASGDAERLQPARIDDDAVLLDEAADARHLGDALGLGDPVADVPVLDGAQLRQALLRAAHDILVDPADAGGIRPQAGRDARRQAPRRRAQIFQHARARPVEVGAVLEDHVDKGDAEEREAAHHPRLRHAQHRGGQGIGDLVLDHLRRLARKFRVDDDLDVGEVGDGVERHAGDGVDAGERHEQGRDGDQEHVACRPADERRDHLGVSGCVNACSAAFRLLSASIRKVAEVTTSSPLSTPSRIST